MRGLHRVAAACMAAGVVLVLQAEQGPPPGRGGSRVGRRGRPGRQTDRRHADAGHA